MDAVHGVAAVARSQLPAIASAVSNAGRPADHEVKALAMTADHDGPGSACACPRATRRTRLNLQVTLPNGDGAVRLARRTTRDVLARCRLAHVEETAVLLVSELVTNAVRHARDTHAIALDLEIGNTWLLIEVQDADPHWPHRRNPGSFDESGFGLVLVDGLADKWGVRDTATGKAVWAELDTRYPAGRRPGQAGRRG
jgi:anti-sigma regulatory factor (Ser/Thr protein kinase)